MRRNSHPLLRGGKEAGESKYSHGFTAAEMQSLASICETILPPLPLNSLEAPNEGQPTNAVQFFCRASGSQPPLPDQVPCFSLSLSLSRSVYYMTYCIFSKTTLGGSKCFRGMKRANFSSIS